MKKILETCNAMDPEASEERHESRTLIQNIQYCCQKNHTPRNSWELEILQMADMGKIALGSPLVVIGSLDAHCS
jgi:hypothetical protein